MRPDRSIQLVYSDEFATLYNGDVRQVLASLPEASVQMCVTSPPYWGLRDYGIEPSIWGGRPTGHKHEWGFESPKRVGKVRQGQGGGSTLTGGHESWGSRDGGTTGQFCSGCDAWRGCLGLEPTPELFVEHLAEVFRGVKRVLRDDGVLWLNIGDSYSSGSRTTTTVQTIRGGASGPQETNMRPAANVDGIKPKDMIGIPWMIAFALRSDGWYLRQDIIWNKINPMPESVTDRCSKVHEYIFLLSKSERYFYDHEAIREETGREATWEQYWAGDGHTVVGNDKWMAAGFGSKKTVLTHPNGRNKRSVWSFASEPFPEPHFATFPKELPRTCILAGTSAKGACSHCGAPWQRIVEKESNVGEPRGSTPSTHRANLQGAQQGSIYTSTKTIGWEPSCKCELWGGEDEPKFVVPCTVLDPFVGSGTTAIVAKELGRRSIGIDLSDKYLGFGSKALAGWGSRTRRVKPKREITGETILDVLE